MSPTGRMLGIVVAWALLGLLVSAWPAFAPAGGPGLLSALTPATIPAWWIAGGLVLVTAAADAAVSFSTRLDTKTIACAKAAAEASSRTKTTTSIAVQASVNVSASCTANAG